MTHEMTKAQFHAQLKRKGFTILPGGRWAEHRDFPGVRFESKAAPRSGIHRQKHLSSLIKITDALDHHRKQQRKVGR